MLITRLFEFDAGHRIPNHKSQCRHLHGHRYKLELTLRGNVLETKGESFEGMVLDFSDIKVIVNKIIDQVDHSFIVSKEDTAMIDFLEQQNSKHTVIDEIPTVENIAQYLGKLLKEGFKGTYNDTLTVETITLWETPNCSVTLNF